MIKHSDYISKFLFYFNQKFNINNLVYYLGFIIDKSDNPINIDDYKTYIDTLKSKQKILLLYK